MNRITLIAVFALLAVDAKAGPFSPVIRPDATSARTENVEVVTEDLIDGGTRRTIRAKGSTITTTSLPDGGTESERVEWKRTGVCTQKDFTAPQWTAINNFVDGPALMCGRRANAQEQ